MDQYTFIMIKPDGVAKRLIPEIILRFKKANLSLVIADVIKLDKEKIAEHYSHLLNKPFYPEIEEFMLSGFVVPMILKGDNPIEKTREIIGATNSKLAKPGTIRGDYGDKETITKNIIHASDSYENFVAER